MRGLLLAPIVTGALCLPFGIEARAQAPINGSALTFKSSGSASGNGWTLSQNGYVGTYVTLLQPGQVTFTLNASGTASNGVFPDMTLSIADYNQSFSVNSGSLTNYSYTTPTLPIGTYFVRTQLDNQTGTATPGLTVGSLAISNNASVPASITDQTALDAANTYINNFRQGTAHVSLPGLAASGTSVQVTMLRNAFNFGGTVSGISLGDSKDMLSSSATPTSQAGQFQSFINQYFNTIVPSNGGKWSSNEATQNNVTMQLVDEQLAYAKKHNMTERMHNLIWGATQQPTWVNSLVDSALGGSTSAKASLNTAITNRINYYVGGTNSGNAERASNYVELDVLNEELHSPTYQTVLGYSGVANIYNQIRTAAAQAGNPNLRIMTNEFNVLQFSPATFNSNSSLSTSNPSVTQSGSDPYANWYRQEVEGINNAGFGKVNTGIGFQMYADVNATGGNVVSANTMQKALQNLSVEGLPLSMTEFGMANSTNSQTLGPTVLDNAVRMVYGNPLADTFMVWGWWDVAGSTPPAQMIVTTTTGGSYMLTPLGQKWVNLMNAFTTPTQSVSVGADGSINFNGFYGEYALTYNGNTYATVDFEKNAAPVIWIKGDYNLDGKLTNTDIQALISALTNLNLYQSTKGMSNEEYLAICDINGDGLVTTKDVQSLMNLLAGVPSATPPAISGVPEPSSFLLTAIGCILLACWACRATLH